MTVSERHNAQETWSIGEEERQHLHRIVRKAAPQVTRDGLLELATRIEGSVVAFKREERRFTTFRDLHNSLRALYFLVDANDPPVGLIRQRVANLPECAFQYIDQRAQRLWRRLLRSDYPPNGLRAWVAVASANDLIRLLQHCISEGGMLRPGRQRGNVGKSRARFEPRILGVVRGNEDRSKGNGRPATSARVMLIAMLAVDWHLATGQMPNRGRSDHGCFGDLVHQLFGWVGIDGATWALRRYWAGGMRP